jgi:uncharacterized membrane protein
MMWKSYRGHANNEAVSPFGGILAAMCMGLMFLAPWLFLAYGAASLWRWLVG